MNYKDIVNPISFFELDHPHLGVVEKVGFITSTIGIFLGVNRKLIDIYVNENGKRQTVALSADPMNFMVTISNKFLLLTMLNGLAVRTPVIRKLWGMQSQNSSYKSFGFGVERIYFDSQGLKWKYSYDRYCDQDELVGFDSSGNEILVMELETLVR